MTAELRRRASGLVPLPLRQQGAHCFAILLTLSIFLPSCCIPAQAAQVSQTPLPVVISVPDTPAGALAQIRFALRSPHPIASGHVTVDFDPAVFGPAAAVDVFSAYGDQMGLARLDGHHVEIFFSSPMGGIGRLPGVPAFTITVPVLVSARVGDGTAITANFAGKPWKDVQGYQYLPEGEPGQLRVGGSLVIEAVTPGGGLLPAGTRVRIEGLGFTAQTTIEIEGAVVEAAVYNGPKAMEVTLASPADLTGKRVVARNPDGTLADFFSSLRGHAGTGFPGAEFQPVFPSRTALLASGWPMVQNASTEAIDVTYVARIGAGAYLQYPTATGRLEPGEIAAGPPVSLANRVAPSWALTLSASKPVRMMTLRAPGPEEGGLEGELIPQAAWSVAPVLHATWTDGKPVCFEDMSAEVTEDPACVAWPVGPTRPNALSLNVRASASPVQVTASVSTNDAGPWLSISPEHATVCGDSANCQPTPFSVRLNSLGLAPGEYSGTLHFTSSGSSYPPLAVPVILRVAASVISVKPAGSVIFTANADGSGAAPVELKVTSSGAPALISAGILKEQKDGEWLSIFPTEATTPATLTVTANPAALRKGLSAALNYVRIVGPANGVARLAGLYLPSQPVTPAITTSAGGNPVMFWLEAGSSMPSTRFLSTGPNPPDKVSIDTEDSGEWLSAALATGPTGAKGVLIAADATALPAGVYRGNIVMSSTTHAEYTPAQVAVTLVAWQDPPPLTVSPGALRSSIPSGGATASECGPGFKLQISSNGLPVGATATASTADDNMWLKVQGASYAEICVAVDARALPPGEYSGTIRITAPSGSQNGASVPVALNVTPATLPGLTGAPPFGFTVVNRASQTVQPLAAGEVISVLGLDLGPAGGIASSPDEEGRLPEEAGGARLLFDGVPAPLLFVSQSEIQAVVPYEIEDRPFVEVAVEFQGLRAVLGSMPVAQTAPGIFTTDGSGQGQADAMNQDTSRNSAGNPADRGTTIAVLATGLGQTVPAGSTGTITRDGRKRPILELTAAVDGVEAVVVDTCSVSGQVEGILRVELRIPEDVKPGPDVPVLLRVGAASSPERATIAVR
ncbi:hypothetical protein [Paludibaculum fermentans]|uniref:hypothetical protein n=1 Tax=Paludibaculum fermentans TaxID=1473598 RepID=UPI003EBA1F8F